MYSSVIFPLLVIFLNEATAQPPLPPHQRHPGDKVVIVVQNENGHPPLPPSNMVMSESKISERKSILAPTLGLKRRGQALQKHNVEDSPPNGGGGKKEKSLLTKLLPTSSRHISGPSDMFRKNFHHAQKSPHGLDEKPRGQPPQYGGGSRPPPLGSGDFRPHQPDITPDFQGGKLSLPVGFNEDSLQSLKPRPTPMANKINPYTNGVAASFPPGIDPYDGFIRYAAENLETPMGNLIDYHSLEHYYGPQHPLSPHYNPNNKDANLNHPYADNYAYNQIDVGNSPPPLPPPQQAGFRDDHNSPVQTNHNEDYNHPNSLNQYEHGIDHFIALSPQGLHGAPPAPPRHRPPYEEGIGHRGAPFEQPSHPEDSFNQNHNAPLRHNPQYHGGRGDNVGGHLPEPPNFEIFEEGPPTHPLPPDAPPQPPPPHHHHPGGPEHGHAPSGDGGEDGIWGILDLAEMIDKGQLPGQQNNAASSSPGKGKPSSNSPPHRGRLVIPIFTRPPPPRSSSSPGSPPGANMPPPPPILSHPDVNHQDEPPPIQIPHPAVGGQDGPPPPPPHAAAPKYPHNSEGFDYDENPAGIGGNFPSRPAQYSALDSQEHEAGNDYNDDYKR